MPRKGQDQEPGLRTERAGHTPPSTSPAVISSNCVHTVLAASVTGIVADRQIHTWRLMAGCTMRAHDTCPARHSSCTAACDRMVKPTSAAASAI